MNSPGFAEISSVRAQGPRQQFDYSTSASADKLREWLIISLSEIGLDPDTDIELVISDRQIDIRRYLPVSPLKRPRLGVPVLTNFLRNKIVKKHSEVFIRKAYRNLFGAFNDFRW